jgi:hypothetical protein
MAYNGGNTPAAALSNEARVMKTVRVKRERGLLIVSSEQ